MASMPAANSALVLEQLVPSKGAHAATPSGSMLWCERRSSASERGRVERSLWGCQTAAAAMPHLVSLGESRDPSEKVFMRGGAGSGVVLMCGT